MFSRPQILAAVFLADFVISFGASAGDLETACNPNYIPCVQNVPDFDCAGGKGNGPQYKQGPFKVTVVGTDVYDLDRNHNGIACDE